MKFKLILAAVAILLAAGCAQQPVASVDYTAFRQNKPRSVIVLPPINNSPDVKASYSVLSQMTFPLAESGYYVLPVTLVSETFRQNGLDIANDIQAISTEKLRQIFGADAALYVAVEKYGTSYIVIDSVTTVSVSAKLVDLRSGATLWTGSASASSNEGSNNNSNSVIGMLVAAAVKQIVNQASDTGFTMAGVASNRLLSAGRQNGILYGPYSPKYGTD